MSRKIAVIPGDGIGPEVIEEGKKCIDTLAELYGFSIDWVEFPYGADYYLEHKVVLPEDGLREIGKCEAIYLGAVGDPRVETGVLEKELLLKLRFYFDQYINLRPVKLYPGVPTPLKNKGPDDINFYVVRENTEDFYVGLGTRFKQKEHKAVFELKRSTMPNPRYELEINQEEESEQAIQLGIISRKGSERAIRYAFELAKKKNLKRVTSVDKANVLTHCYSLWRDVFTEVAKNYPNIETEFSFVDAITMWFVKNPEWYQVVVTPNMFGDIITDLGAMIQGGMGLAPGGNINPEGISMFEPIHGSAPKYKGMRVADPIATILAGQMLLEEIGETKAAETLEKAVIQVLKEGKTLTKDLGGTAKTNEVGDVTLEAIKNLYHSK